MLLRCVVIDKDPSAIELISRYIERFPSLKLSQTFTDVLAGGEFLRSNTVDILFIELNMANKSAIHLINSLTGKLLVVFTVGCNQLPKEILSMDILDYLVKPFSYERFSKTAFKAVNKFENKITTGQTIYIRSAYQLVRIRLDEIEYIESVENYIRIHLVNGKPIMSLAPLSSFSEKLPQEKFIRIHRKYVIAIDKIEHLSNKKIKLNSTELPVGHSHLDNLRIAIRK